MNRCWFVSRNTTFSIIPSDIPNAAICGSFFHFPKDAGGLIHVTVLCRSRSPIDRSATWQMNQKCEQLLNSKYEWALTVKSPLSIFTSFFSLLCSVMSWSNTTPYSSWIFCISLMWLATLFMALIATWGEEIKLLELSCWKATCFHLSFLMSERLWFFSNL